MRSSPTTPHCGGDRRGKDLTANCHGGEVTRTLFDKRKEGKKKLRQLGKGEIPREAFIAALKMDAD